MGLADRRCRDGAARIEAAQASAWLAELAGWAAEGDRLRREWRLRDFAAALAFVNAVAEVAERENHHPDLLLHGWNRVTVTTWTHSAGGLSENDFVLAAKIDRLPLPGASPPAG